MAERVEVLRSRHPEVSRVQRLYFNSNTMLVGMAIGLCLMLIIHSFVTHTVLDYWRDENHPKTVYVTVCNLVPLSVPLFRWGGVYQ